MEVSNEPTMKCTLEEFYDAYLKNHLNRTEDIRTLRNGFKGKEHVTPRFRIRCADQDVFFNNRELLCRFAGMSTPSQSRFIQGIKEALEKSKVKRIEITIPWSENYERRLDVREGGGLNFELI